MASSHGTTHSESAKMEQIITEFFAKSLHIILESRTPFVSSRNYSGEQAVSSPSSSSSSSSSVRPRDKWFNLALRECPAALENIDLWRQSNLEPIVVDVILIQRPVDWDPLNFSPKRDLRRNLSLKERNQVCWNPDQEEPGCEPKSEKIIERWILQYESRRMRDSSSGSRRSSSFTLQTLYKKSTLLLRSLYATVRLLPAYKIFRDLNSSGQVRSSTLAHRFSSFVEPSTLKEEAEMKHFGFTPVDSSSGRLCLSVLYCSSVLDVSSEPSTSMSPQVINNYVGSPLAESLRRFPSLPVTGLPTSLPFFRRHSWSYDNYRASPPSITYSPLPTYSESHASGAYPNRRLPPASLPPHPPGTALIQKKDTSCDEYTPFPSYSPSPSPSPPIHIPGNHLSKALLRSESAPVRIPAINQDNSPAFHNRHNLPPSSHTRNADSNAGVMQIGTTPEKFFLGKDEPRKFSGAKISTNSSSQISISRSSSTSHQDDFDDPDLICPFDLDYDDMTEPGPRPESFDQGNTCEVLDHGVFFPMRKSQDAAVGALVHMLKKAPPLRQDFTGSVGLLQSARSEAWSDSAQKPSKTPEPQSLESVMSSGLVMPKKTTADALEEFQGYRVMKNLLLTQGSKSDA